MTDTLSPERRSDNMRRIRGKSTRPEILVRRLLHRMGFRFRLHRRDLPGTPDIVLPRHGKIVLVHGCFWHGHPDPRCVDGRRQPKSNLDYWIPKLQRNKQRDLSNEEALRALGWNTLIVWECETKRSGDLAARLRAFLTPGQTLRNAA